MEEGEDPSEEDRNGSPKKSSLLHNLRPLKPLQEPSLAFDPAHPQIMKDILQMIVQYLRANGYNAGAAVLADEAQLRISDHNVKRQQLKQLRRAIVDAEWETASSLLVKTCARKSQRHCLYLIYRQQYLELVHTQQTQRAFTFLNKRLKPLEGHLSGRDGVEVQEGEFAELCYLLTCRSIRDSRLFSWWPGELRGREMLAEEVLAVARLEEQVQSSGGIGLSSGLSASSKNLSDKKGSINGDGKVLSQLTPSKWNSRHIEMPPNRLVQMLQQAVAFQIEFNRYRTFDPLDQSHVISLATDYECVATPNALRDVLVGHCFGSTKAAEFVGDSGSLVVAGGSDNRLLLWNTNRSDDDDDDDDDDDYREHRDEDSENLQESGNAGEDKPNIESRPLIRKQRLPICELGRHAARIWDVCANREGTHVASVAADGTTALWGIPDPDVMREYSPSRGVTKTGKSDSTHYAFSKEERTSAETEAASRRDLFLCAEMGCQESFQTTGRSSNSNGSNNGSQSRNHSRDVYAVAWHPNGRHLVTGGHDRRVSLLDLNMGTRVSLMKALVGHEAAVVQVGTNPFGNLMVSASRDGTVRFWDSMSGLCVKTLGDQPGTIGTYIYARYVHISYLPLKYPILCSISNCIHLKIR